MPLRATVARGTLSAGGTRGERGGCINNVFDLYFWEKFKFKIQVLWFYMRLAKFKNCFNFLSLVSITKYRIMNQLKGGKRSIFHKQKLVNEKAAIMVQCSTQEELLHNEYQKSSFC